MKVALFALLAFSGTQNFSLAPGFEPTLDSAESAHPLPETLVAVNSVYALESWVMGDTVKSADHSLANLSADLETVILSFAKPSSHYILGQWDWRGSGLNFSAPFSVVRNAVTILKMKNPKVRVLLGVGGPTYLNWQETHPRSIASLVSDLGLDGVDLNYQPVDIGLPDKEIIQLVRAFREQLPRPLILSATVWPFMDVWSSPLEEIGGHFDELHVPSAEGVDTTPVLRAYQEIYKGPLYWSRTYRW